MSYISLQCTCRCDAVYVGRTSQRLEDRVKQHVPKCLLTHLRQQSSLCVENPTLSQNTLARLSISAIGQHLLESPLCADDFSTNQFEILERARNMLQLHVLEALHIHFANPISASKKNWYTS